MKRLKKILGFIIITLVTGTVASMLSIMLMHIFKIEILSPIKQQVFRLLGNNICLGVLLLMLYDSSTLESIVRDIIKGGDK